MTVDQEVEGAGRGARCCQSFGERPFFSEKRIGINGSIADLLLGLSYQELCNRASLEFINMLEDKSV